MAAATAVGIDEVQVVAADLDPLRVAREAEAEHRPGDVVELEHVLFGDDLGQRPVGRVLARHRAGPDRLEAPVEADRAGAAPSGIRPSSAASRPSCESGPPIVGLDRRRETR